ncbi:hypothetical protein [Leifsonia shinshuensis]|uniref:hypothetical protein n=1 Tax=Leifsonia shinshuensis TaxID=150026 RepID=UPI00285C76BB|nr:hypothetical protein [Leifsonia shinshuensis]MDR6969757.1 hypothetical protein [Leifsonia shinshuensis]
MADRRRPWWLAWTNPQIAWFHATLSSILFVFFTAVWLPGKNWFVAAVYAVLIVLCGYSWWAAWYLANRWGRR